MLVSGLISARGAPRSLILLWLEGSFELITCPALLAELERVFLRPKFRSYVTVHEVRGYVALLGRLTSVEPDPEVSAGLTPDPGDDYLVALAAANAAYLVTGDNDLLELSDAPVRSPRAFFAMLVDQPAG